jgi:hypothetical protein
MANIGPNRGRVLRTALNRFAAMLLDEARTFTGLSYSDLDEALGLEEGQSYRYSLYPRTRKTRAPQAASIQQLENRVARLLKRHAHRLVVQNNKTAGRGQDEIIGAPGNSIDFDNLVWSNLQIAYEHDWPTFRRLKGRSAMPHYLWQWGILWDKGLIPHPWSRQAFGLPSDMPVEAFLPALTKAHVIVRRDLAAGNLPEFPSHDELLSLARSYGFPC